MTLRDDMVACRRCLLRGGCTQVIPGQGAPNAKLVIVGEAGGADEDLLGEPFKGQCGKYLDKLLVASGIDRSKCYVTNTVKCRPPKNRTPTDQEISNCSPWLKLEIQETKPKLILSLGKTPTRFFLELKKTFTLKHVVGHYIWSNFSNCYVVPWYHPSYLLQYGRKLEQQTVEFLKRVKVESGL